ncbi:MAG: TPM domain-containing protein, partial [Planctomycetota bacterium]|nr:TPM domain-containing protein [Planctomycetota bacterium]
MATSTRRRFLTTLFVGASLLAVGMPAWAASGVRDNGGMFSPAAIRKAEEALDAIERDHHVPVLIETIDSVGDRKINELALELDKKSGRQGIFILMAKAEHLMSNTLVASETVKKFGVDEDHRKAIRDAFLDEFKKKDFDGGLLRGVEAIDHVLSRSVRKSRASGPVAPGLPGAAARPRGPAGGKGEGGFNMGWLIGLVVLLFVVMIVLRVIGAIFRAITGGGGAPGYGPGAMGRPGYGGPGYGGPGYGGGGGGGGFMSGLFGGLGGALAGNWLYDQFRGHPQGGAYPPSYTPGADPAAGPDAGYNPDGTGIVGADDNGGQGGSWGTPDNGGDGGGWAPTGGGDDGGGGNWGGGGGDWGGGGGDWGG